MLEASDPAILSSPISPFLGEHAFRSALSSLLAGLLGLFSARNGNLPRQLEGQADVGIQADAAVSGGERVEGDCQGVSGR